MKELTSQEVIEIHDRIIERYGGTKGLLYQGTVDHLVYLLNRTNDVFEKIETWLRKKVLPLHLR